MEIKTEPVDIMLEKLGKIKCCTGCLDNVNYLVFGHGNYLLNLGLYCSSCFSQLSEMNNDQFINMDGLATILVDISEAYGKKIKGDVSQVNLIKGELDGARNEVKKSKDGLIYDLKTIKEKSNAMLDELYTECLRQNKNEPLQAFYEPDITATLILNESQLILHNLNNLKISKDQKGQIKYKLQEMKKSPQQVNQRVNKQFKELKVCIESTIMQANGVIDNFMKEIAEEKKSKNG